MQFYTKSKILLRQILGHELKAEVELYCKTFSAGGWSFSPIGINSSSVIFSLGIANDIRFDKSLIDSFACDIHAFDPTPGWIDWIAGQKLPPEFHFYPYAIGSQDGTVRLREDAIELPAKRVQTVMSQLGVEAIDILKMDIESAEYKVIDDILDSGVLVYQLLVEFHHRFKSVPIEKTKSVLEKLSAAGYRIFHISEKYREFSFIHEQTYYRHVDESLNGRTPKYRDARRNA